ncbi:ricin-type beta-trefoil lectin domain protein [Archangium primigenium]|uniref:ricin-type beta-trefoil lectin domain protein n=1 Tax=[Archangium] primigenium TaxID=2792470 RepID=UPI001958787D|nr:ricin-type beta-trefoil lectin domain protein [Archangium primigenium]MBM7113653.1 ricin-type beta-trefoil lectin domain protein [Archangium primigenium]
MTRKLPALTALTALFAGMSALAAPVPAVVPMSVPEASPEVLSAMQRDLGLSPAQSMRRMAVEALAAHTEQRLAAELGDTFGGAWMNEDGSALIVAVTDESSMRQVLRQGAEPKLVTRSLAQLERMRTVLDRNAERAPRGIFAWSVDVRTNSVVVTALDEALAKGFIADSGADVEGLRVEVSREEYRPLYDIRGGDAYYPGNARCSIGFAVNGGFVTAGHCGGVGTNTTGSGVAQGTVRGSTFPGKDQAWVQTNGSWVAQPWVNNYAGGVANVAGSNEATVGSSVCRSGSTTGWRCGTIQARGATINYANGPVYGAVQTNACAEGGDSGGSWISGDQAQGVTSGGSGNCSTGGTTFFFPLKPILQEYGLTLKTSGGGSTGGKAIRSRLNNKCIDIPNSNTNDGTQLQMWDCNGTGAQSWQWYSDGSVRALGKCMDVAWGSVDAGAIIQIANCSGNPAQKFILSGAGDLVNPQANKCVDIVDHNQNSGAKLIQWTCTGANNQKWYQ